MKKIILKIFVLTVFFCQSCSKQVQKDNSNRSFSKTKLSFKVDITPVQNIENYFFLLKEFRTRYLHRVNAITKNQAEIEINRIKYLVAKEGLTIKSEQELFLLLGFESIEKYKEMWDNLNAQSVLLYNNYKNKKITKLQINNSLIRASDLYYNPCLRIFNRCCDNALFDATACVLASVACGPFIWACGSGCLILEIKALKNCTYEYQECLSKS